MAPELITYYGYDGRKKVIRSDDIRRVMAYEQLGADLVMATVPRWVLAPLPPMQLRLCDSLGNLTEYVQ